MKKFRNIFLLTGLLASIVFIWLIPKTRGEKKTHYVRVYTEEKEVARESDSTGAGKSSTKKEEDNSSKTEKNKNKKERVTVQVDTLTGKIRMKDLKMSLYSRGMHFRPIEVETNDPLLDSVATNVDSVSVN